MKETWDPRTRDPTREGRDLKAQGASSAADLAPLQVGAEGCGTPGGITDACRYTERRLTLLLEIL